jgi:nicotinamide-nucleotide amidase
MRAELVAIGDELVNGQRIDTNSAWLGQELADLGIQVQQVTVVRDQVEPIAMAFHRARQHANVVVSTGGLGPTADDLTRHAIAEVSGRPLQLVPEVLDHIRHLFTRLGRTMPSRNEIQAMLPKGSRVIANPHGTAPGIDVQVAAEDGRESRIFALPGVPAEMRQMWLESVAPALRTMGAGQRVIRHRRIKCFGVGESALEQMLPDLTRRDRNPSVGITVHQATITLRITAEDTCGQACDAAMQPTIETIGQCLGDLVFGEEDDELQHAVTRQLRRLGATLATAECATEGLVAHWLRSLPEASSVHRGGWVVGSWDALASAVGLPERSAPTAGDSLAEDTRRTAAALLTIMDADYGLAIGPRPQGDSENASPATVPIALADHDGVALFPHRLAGHPDIVVPRCAKQALNRLRLHLAKKGPLR